MGQGKRALRLKFTRFQFFTRVLSRYIRFTIESKIDMQGKYSNLYLMSYIFYDDCPID